MSDLIQYLPLNEKGRDFFIGDIHGCYANVRALMDQIDFDVSKDRLISVGDLVDRGPLSVVALGWLQEPWFFAVRGNHEQMAIDYVDGIQPEDNYILNGGQWFVDMSPEERAPYVDAFCKLPFLIEVAAKDDGVIGVVHADPVVGDWDLLKEAIELATIQMCALWSRQKATKQDDEVIANCSMVVVGHTVVSKPGNLGNVIYIDTGVYKTSVITAAEVVDGKVVMHQHRVSKRRAA